VTDAGTPATPADARLRQVLGGEPPAALLGLPEADKTAFADLVEQARRRQREDLGRSFTASLKHVPFPVRGIVKKVLLG
jgi:hypothetical protein